MNPPVASVEERRLYAIGIVLTTYIFFAICDAAAKWMALSGVPPTQVGFGRYLVQFAFILGLILPRAGVRSFNTNNLKLQILRALGLLGMTVFNFFAVLYLPLTMTASIMFGLPLLITALSVPFLGEQVGWRRWAAIIIGFIGILIIVQPWGADFHWAVFLSLCCILSGAFYYILTRKLAGSETTMSMQLYAGLVGTIVLMPFAFSNWVWPSDLVSWLIFASVGLAAMTGHQIAIIAHRLAPASVLAPFAYSQIIWMSLASWLIFNEPPDVWLFIGAPIVIGSGLYIWLRERALARSTVTPVAPYDAEDVAKEEARGA